MLALEELKNIANLKRMPLENAEKDYLQEMILLSIYSNAGNELVFKGGTCLYKVYKLNRFSEDLDFTLTKKIDMGKISNKIITDLMMFNIKAVMKEIKEFKNQINIRLLLNGPLYKGSKETQCFIPLNISLKEKVLHEPNRKSIVPIYKELPNFELFAMQEKEILAEKVRAILTRIKPRDAYDLWFLLAVKNIEFDSALINEKLALINARFNFEEFRNRLEKMEGFWKIDLKRLIIGELPDFNTIKDEILTDSSLQG